jgi:hypothetical protein
MDPPPFTNLRAMSTLDAIRGRERVRIHEAGAGLIRNRWEVGGYGAVALAFAALLWWQVRRVNGFYLDEWIYVSGAQTIWNHLPAGLVDGIPGWDRGVQRGYSTLLSPLEGLLGRSAAFTAGHVLNVLLLSVASVPAVAQLARRVIVAPGLRVLAVGLAVVIPWAMVGAHLLTENLAYPAFLWTCLAIVRAAEEPALGRQAVALGAIVFLVLCRVDLGVMAGTLVLASLGGELLRPRAERPLRAVLRRQAPILALLAIGVAGAVYLLGPGASKLGAYGILNFHSVHARLFGAESGAARDTAMTYTRSLVLGSVLLPFALGLGTALAGAAGRLGRSIGLFSLVALGSLVFVVGGVTLFTSGAALEERYVFYACAPLALLACTGIERARALWPWAAAAGAFTLWIVASANPFPAVDSGNFFAAPAGAFWTRVMDYRLRTWEHDLLGWLGLEPRGWLFIAAALAALVAVLALARRRPRAAGRLLTAALAICLLGQATILSYSLHEELYGTVDVAGGIAAGPRETFVDRALPSGADAGVVPALVSAAELGGGAERLEFWNGRVDATVALSWDGTPVPAPPGFGVMWSSVGADGVAALSGKLTPFLVAQVDDPRVQFASRLVERSHDSQFGLFRDPHRRALWTAEGLQADAAVVSRTPIRLTVDRAAGVRAAQLTLQAPQGAARAAAWRITAHGHTIASGRLADGATHNVLLRAPKCVSGACPPWSWQLASSGPGALSSLPVYGQPLPPRHVAFWMPAVRLVTGGRNP